MVSGKAHKRGIIQTFFASQRESQHLCWSCRTLDFPALFDGSTRIFSKKMGWIYKRAGACEFCRLLLKALSTLYPNLKQISQGHCVITAARSVGGESLTKCLKPFTECFRNWLWYGGNHKSWRKGKQSLAMHHGAVRQPLMTEFKQLHRLSLSKPLHHQTQQRLLTIRIATRKTRLSMCRYPTSAVMAESLPG